MGSLKPEEQRRSLRHCISRLAKIQFGIDTEARYCLVTDISDGGVRLYVNGFHVPDEFVLLLSGGGAAEESTYRVVWRHGHEVGGKFVSVGQRTG